MKPHIALYAAACGLLLSTAAHAVNFDLVSRRSNGTPAADYSDGSQQPDMSADGRYVVFVADAPSLTPAGASGYQAYLRDRTAGTAELISVSTAGVPGNAASSRPSVSSDGCRVVFTSFASNLVAGDTNGLQDVFVRDRCVGPTTSLISATPSGVAGNAASVEGRISLDGNYAVFVSDATNIAVVTNSGFNCLFRRHIGSGTTVPVTTGGGACIVASVPDISQNGARIAFWAYTSPGTSGPLNGVWQIYLYDYAAGPEWKPGVVSTNASGLPQSQGSEGASTVSAPAISSDGGFVAFASRGGGLIAGSGGNYQVYVKDIANGTLVRASVDSAGNAGNANSSGGGQGFRPGLSAQAQTVTFLTSATNLAPEIGAFVPNVVAHNPYTGLTRGFTADKTLNGTPAISANNQFIAANSNYALDPDFSNRGMFIFDWAATPSRLFGISTRAAVLTGDNVLIAGFVVGGGAPKTVVVRARGPSLGLAGALQNPVLTLVPANGAPAVVNDDWGTAANAAQLVAAGMQPGDARDSAIMMTLDPGAYTAIVSGGGGSTGLAIAEVYEMDQPDAPLVGISTRGRVGTGDSVIIGGFVIAGTTPQTVIVRARGPSLTASNVAGALQDPVLTLVPADGSPAVTNDNWQAAANASQVTASGFAPSDAREAAILITLNPGAYTAIVSGAAGATGVAIIEVFRQ